MLQSGITLHLTRGEPLEIGIVVWLRQHALVYISDRFCDVWDRRHQTRCWGLAPFVLNFEGNSSD